MGVISLVIELGHQTDVGVLASHRSFLPGVLCEYVAILAFIKAGITTLSLHEDILFTTRINFGGHFDLYYPINLIHITLSDSYCEICVATWLTEFLLLPVVPSTLSIIQHIHKVVL